MVPQQWICAENQATGNTAPDDGRRPQSIGRPGRSQQDAP